jgi:hypothetical protein
MQKKHIELLAAVCGEFIGNGNAPQVEAYVTEGGWTVEELDEALKALGEEAGVDMGWL